MLAADYIFTYFQYKLGQTHYDMFVGDNDTGKTANLVYFQCEGYRAMLDVDITPANIYGFLGTFEEGQGRVPKSVFARRYFAPQLEYRDKRMCALDELLGI